MASDGDPRVLFVLNLVLSMLFASVVIWGLSYLDVVGFTPVNVAILGLLIVLATEVVTR